MIDLRAQVFELANVKYKHLYSHTTYLWMNTPNKLLAGVTPIVYIEEGHGDKLIKMLEQP